MVLFTSVLSLVFLASLAGILYPFKPYKKRSRAAWSAFAAFVLIGVVGPETADRELEKAETASRESTSIASTETPTSHVSQRVVEDKFREMWVTSDRLNRRTCASTQCGVVGVLFFRERVEILEESGGWVRVTKPYDAACTNGRSTYVDSGNTACEAENGIVDGQFAEWVSTDYLSSTEPEDPAKTAKGFETIIAQSDDFAKYRTEFAEAAGQLISQARCSEANFREMGGWVKSTEFKNEPIYFTYCGSGYTKYYLNVSTGRIYQ